jgi:hypothetical protein
MSGGSRMAVLLALVAAWLGGCGDYGYREPAYEMNVEPGAVLRSVKLPAGLAERILALEADRVTAADVAEVLSRAPAPRIVGIHGGTLLVHLQMESYGRFLIRMGYPETKIRHPRDGAYSYSCLERSDKLAGILAWYYEREGMRPMLIGHSQGGIQAVKVLHQLAGTFADEVHVWDPIRNRRERRTTIVDPLTGRPRPVVGVQVCYAAAVGAGGITRVLPQHWSMTGRLRAVPDSVVEFTGFYMPMDILGGDLLGFAGSANTYSASGTARVRTVRLPPGTDHYSTPNTEHLATHPATADWINRYTPGEAPPAAQDINAPTHNILFAAETWTGIKRHWCLELQRLIRARRGLDDGR